MANERWESPFPYTLAYNLFKQHFTELNRVYWAFVPAKDTIKKAAKNIFLVVPSNVEVATDIGEEDLLWHIRRFIGDLGPGVFVSLKDRTTYPQY